MPTTCCVRGCRSRGSGNGNDTKIKYFRFPKDEARRLLWLKAIQRENYVPTNNSMICYAHFTIDDYQKRPDLVKLTNRAVPSVFNCEENVKKRTVNQNKIMIGSDFKHSQKTDRKCYNNLSDHTYVLKLPESPDKCCSKSTDNSFDPSSCMIQTLKVIENVKVEPKPLDLSTLKKPTLNDSKNLYFQITKDPFVNSEKKWKDIALVQTNTIKNLRKKIKVLQQKIRRHAIKIETLKKKFIEELKSILNTPRDADRTILFKLLKSFQYDEQ